VYRSNIADEHRDVELDFGEDDLIPAIAQDAETGDVLMLAYVSPEALAATQNTGLAHYYSRSRDELWQKGGSSGHVQKIEESRVDCDADALLYRVPLGVESPADLPGGVRELRRQDSRHLWPHSTQVNSRTS